MTVDGGWTPSGRSTLASPHAPKRRVSDTVVVCSDKPYVSRIGAVPATDTAWVNSPRATQQAARAERRRPPPCVRYATRKPRRRCQLRTFKRRRCGARWVYRVGRACPPSNTAHPSVYRVASHTGVRPWTAWICPCSIQAGSRNPTQGPHPTALRLRATRANAEVGTIDATKPCTVDRVSSLVHRTSTRADARRDRRPTSRSPQLIARLARLGTAGALESS